MGTRLFRFEPHWNLDFECNEVVKQVWQRRGENVPSLGSTSMLLSQCQKELTDWSSAKFGDVSRRIRPLTDRLERLQQRESEATVQQIEQIQAEISALLEMEDLKWKQRAKLN